MIFTVRDWREKGEHMMDVLSLNASKLKSLHAAYRKAVEENSPAFEWRGVKLDTQYAKYLIEYMSGRLQKKATT